jgi:DNA-binding XRE family transcriptional regulator
MTSGKTISENIKKLRAKLGLTQDDGTAEKPS